MSFASLPLKKIKLVVFDVDGTLYPQFPIRRNIALLLLWEAFKTKSFKTAEIIRAYRALREVLCQEEAPDFEARIKKALCREFSLSPEQYDRLITEWLFQKPLPWLEKIRFPHLDEVFALLRQKQIKTAIFSDYPAKDKLKALHLQTDYSYWAGDPEIQALKPHPKGLLHIIQKAGVRPEETLMIGDRDEKDGALARRAGTHFLLRGKAKENSPHMASFTQWSELLCALRQAL